MPLGTAKLEAVCFDLGNTLIEWGPKQALQQYDAMAAVLCRLFGHCDAARLRAIRQEQAARPYTNGFRENVLEDITREILTSLYDSPPTREHVEILVRTRYESFLDTIRLPGEVIPLLGDLSNRYRLGMISNYPYAEVIRDGLRQWGIGDFFETVVVSADVGYTKPHPRPFDALLSAMDLDPGAVVHVGDNWLADVQGAKRRGMMAVWTRQYEASPEAAFEPADGDLPAEARIRHIDELRELLGIA